MMPARIEWGQVEDANGRSYRLPATTRVMDCAGCGVLLVKRHDLAGPKTSQPKLIGGHLFDLHGHPRPYCLECYLRNRGVNYRALGITDG